MHTPQKYVFLMKTLQKLETLTKVWKLRGHSIISYHKMTKIFTPFPSLHVRTFSILAPLSPRLCGERLKFYINASYPSPRKKVNRVIL